MSKIVEDKLFIGDITDANNHNFIRKNDINCIISLTNMNMNMNMNNRDYKLYKYYLQDNHQFPIYEYFDEICDLIEKQDVVLVSCVSGISLSATIIIAYLMKYFRLDLRNSFLAVRSCRRFICPNKQFIKYLLDYELKLFGKNSITFDKCIEIFYYT